MKRSDTKKADATTARMSPREDSNGHHSADGTEVDLGAILAGLQTMRDGDFSIRLPGTWTGVGGKIADCFNEIIVANQRMAQALKREPA